MARNWKTLSQELAEMEARDPKLAELSRAVDEAVLKLTGQDRMSRYKRHREGQCVPRDCEYVHTPEERSRTHRVPEY